MVDNVALECDLRLRSARVMTLAEQRRVCPSGAVAIRNRRILAIGPDEEVRGYPCAPGLPCSPRSGPLKCTVSRARSPSVQTSLSSGDWASRVASAHSWPGCMGGPSRVRRSWKWPVGRGRAVGMQDRFSRSVLGMPADGVIRTTSADGHIRPLPLSATLRNVAGPMRWTPSLWTARCRSGTGMRPSSKARGPPYPGRYRYAPAGGLGRPPALHDLARGLKRSRKASHR
jgi:hypothetical protein